METAYSNIEINFMLLNGIILVPAVVNDVQGYLIFDTGAMKTGLHRKYFPDIQGKELEIAKFSGEIANDTAAEITIRSLSFSGVTLTDCNAMLMNLSYVEDSLLTFDPSLRLLGTMGIDIIQRFTVMIDYEENKITLNPLCGFDEYICVPLQMEALPVIKIEIGGEQYRFVLDTGANTCLLGTHMQDRVSVQPVNGSSNVFNISSVSLQNRPYSNIISVFTDISAIQSKVFADGVIGYHILSPQRSYLDFSNQELYLEAVTLTKNSEIGYEQQQSEKGSLDGVAAP